MPTPKPPSILVVDDEPKLRRMLQDYLTLHPNQAYIAINDLPKVENLKRMFPGAYRAEPALVAKTGL